jgi:iron complex outermembrane recepter protein
VTALRHALALGGVSLLALAAPARAETVPADPAPPGDGTGPAIVVTATPKKAEVSTGALGVRALLDTPFSVSSLSADQIQAIAATTIDAAFTYDAGVHSNNSGVASGNTFSVRGIAIDRTNGYKVDGLPFPYWFQDFPIEDLQDLQILKGAGGFAYGFSAPGGIVNLVTRQPTQTFQAEFTTTFRSSSILNEHIDIGGPLDPEGKVAFRFNAVNEEGRLYNGAYNKDQFASLALVAHLSDKVSVQLDGFYQRTRQDDQVNTISFTTTRTTVGGKTYGPVTSLAPLDGSLQPGEKGTSKLNDIGSLTGRVNYQISGDWKLSVAARYATLDERFPGSLATIYDNAGDYYSTVYNMNRIFKYYVTDAGLTGKFATGPITHQIVVGASTLTSQFEYDNPTRNYVLAGTFNIYNPNSVPSIIGNATAATNNRPPVWTLYQEIHQRALFASDTATWGPVSALVGVRYTDYEEINYNPNESLTSYFHYHPVSPVYSLDLTVLHGVRLYATYVQAIQRGALAPATATNANDSYGPLTSTQYEVGVKAEGRWGNASLALYRIATPSEYVDSTNTFVRNGIARYQGIEFNAVVRPVRALQLNTSVSWLDAKQVSGPVTLIGQTIAGTVGFQASELAEYAVPFVKDLKVTGGVRHSGKAYGASDIFVYQANTEGDLGLRYDLVASGHAVVLRANVQNVTNEKYWIPGSAGTSISAGAPRTYTFSAEIALQQDRAAAYAAAPGDGGSAHHAYLELDGGALFGHSFDAAVNNRVDNLGSAPGAIRAGQKTGWDFDGIVGYDLGRFSGEIETGYKRAGVGAIDYSNATVAVDSTHGAGVYDNAGGHTGVLSVLANALLNLGPVDGATRGFVGGGAGIARISSRDWTLDSSRAPLVYAATAAGAATPTYFSDDDATGFAWQALAGVRHSLGRHVDVVLKYRYFEVPGLTLRTMNANQLKGNLFGSSVLAGVAWKL